MLSGRKITTVSSATKLAAMVGNNFVLFLGSAVSGVTSPSLAMVDKVRDEILNALSIKNNSDSYLDSLYKEYARLLSEKDCCYKNLLDSTKFESFLRMVSQASSRDAINDLLNKLYTCEKDEPGPNHKAVAALLKSGKCTACFTTNFDNAIELACTEAGVDFKIYNKLGEYPAKLPDAGEKPAIIKLHGSAPEYNCVAESSELLIAQSQETHGRLKILLEGKSVLVFGYGGFGDIDISPHLSETKATFFWTNFQYPKLDELPDWASYFVLTDLRYPLEGKPPNLLVELAGLTIRPGDIFKKHEGAGSIIKKWCARTDLDAKKLVMSVFAWRRTRPVLHLYHEEFAKSSLATHRVKYGLACAQARIYRTGYDILSRELMIGVFNNEERYRAIQGQGFALWRMGKWEEVRELLEELINGAPGDFSQDDRGIVDLLSDIYRTYLEVCRDMLQILPPNKRQQAAKIWRLEETFRTLNNMIYESPENQILAHFVGRNIDWLLGKNISVSEIKELYERCKNFEIYNSASVVLSLLLQMSLIEGVKQFGRLNHKFRRSGVNHYIGKNRESLAFAILGPLFLRLGVKGHHLLRVIFRGAYGFNTNLGERRYKKQLRQWSQWKQRWITNGTIQTEMD